MTDISSIPDAPAAARRARRGEGPRNGGLAACRPEQLLNVLPAAVYVCDAAGLIVDYNARAVELWGREPRRGDSEERFCGSFRLYWPDGRPLPHDQTPMVQVLRDGVPAKDLEVFIERPDGSRIVALVNIVPLTDERGRVTGALNCFQDITERKRAEERAQQNERAFRELLEALPAALYTTDAAGRITFYNEAAAEFWGRRPEPGEAEWCGSWRLYWPDGAPMRHDQCPMAVALKENRPIRGVEAVAERPDGTRVPFIPYPTPLRDASGALVGAVNMLVDLTELKQAEESRQRLAAIVESSDDAIVSKDLDGIITSWNRGAERLFGYTAEEAIGKPVMMLIPPERHDEGPGILDRLRRGQRVDHYETVRRHKDGRLIDISLTVSPVRNAEGRVVGASKIARDITERKRAEERQALLMAELDHRVKNALATVQSIANQTLAPGRPAETFTGRLAALAKAHGLLAAGHWEGARLHAILEQELAPYRGEPKERVAISGDDVLLAPRIAQTLAMAMHELTTNAAKYGALSVPEGRVEVSWTVQALPGDRRLALQWIERDGPPVKPPSRRSFGSTMIEWSVKYELDGEVRLEFRPEGVRCAMNVPLAGAAGGGCQADAGEQPDKPAGRKRL